MIYFLMAVAVAITGEGAAFRLPPDAPAPLASEKSGMCGPRPPISIPLSSAPTVFLPRRFLS
jgi:hypothetical protein